MLWGCAACSSSKWISNESTCQFPQTNWRDGNPASNDKASCQRLSKFSAALPVVSVSKGSRLRDGKLILIRKICSATIYERTRRICPKMCRLAHSAWLKMCIFEKSGRSPPVCLCLSCLHFIIVNNRKHFLNFPFYDMLLLLSLCRYLIPDSSSSLSMCKNRLKQEQKSCSVFDAGMNKKNRPSRRNLKVTVHVFVQLWNKRRGDPRVCVLSDGKSSEVAFKCLDSPIYATTTLHQRYCSDCMFSEVRTQWSD